MANWQTHGVGLHNVGSYQSSGIPYVTGSADMAASGSAGMQDKIEFPTVTKSVTLINTGTSELRLHFADATTETATWTQFHYVALPHNKDSVTLNVKCSDIYVSNAGTGTGKYTLFAELTNIPRERMFKLSGSGINEDTRDA